MANPWIQAMRLRTLPLAISGILCGAAVAKYDQFYSFTILFWSLLTAILLQILSNFANDYGDYMKGVDNDQRLGDKRAMQSGLISPIEMKVALVITSILCLLCGIKLLTVAFRPSITFFVFLLIGLLAIAAALKYTIGKTAYGYKGLGDVFVFIFFGIVAVTGSTWLHTQQFEWLSLLPATTIGLYSAAVLHINNTRDMENDKAGGKYTLAIALGLKGSRIYLCTILTIGFFASVAYTFLVFTQWYQPLWVFSVTPILYVAVSVCKLPPSPAYNGLLKMMSLSTLAYAVLFSLVHWWS
ncbi:MAG: 1,4-dihydroxy-2-naphthoate octaprenyltransferase [Bacteroidetes bacterium]|nr:1,4-dihydroxy-2-naphthoate octaprenyltransferase [Bacteroidota bacterium]